MRATIAVLLLASAAGCSEQLVTQVSLSDELRAALRDQSLATLMVGVEQRPDSRRPALRSLWILERPGALSDEALAAALPTFRYDDAELVAVDFIGYRESADALGAPRSGDLVAASDVVRARALPEASLVYRRELRRDDWSRLSSLPEVLAGLPLLPAAPTCPRLAGRNIAPGGPTLEIQSMAGVPDGFVLAGIDIRERTSSRFHLGLDGETWTTTSTQPGLLMLTSMTFDGVTLWGTDGRSFYRLSSDGSELSAPTTLGRGGLTLLRRSDGGAAITDGVDVWPLAQTGTLTPSRPPVAFDKIAVGPGGKMCTLALETIDATRKRIKVQLTQDGTHWEDATPTRSEEFTGRVIAGYDVVASEDGFFLIADRYAWIREYGASSWRPIEVPAIGVQSTSNTVFNLFRHVHAMRGGRIVVGGERGSLDVLWRTVGGTDVWCVASTGTYEWYEEITATPSGGVIGTYVKEDGVHYLKGILTVEVPD